MKPADHVSIRRLCPPVALQWRSGSRLQHAVAMGWLVVSAVLRHWGAGLVLGEAQERQQPA
jgi:hypothetical protein